MVPNGYHRDLIIGSLGVRQISLSGGYLFFDLVQLRRHDGYAGLAARVSFFVSRRFSEVEMSGVILQSS